MGKRRPPGASVPRPAAPNIPCQILGAPLAIPALRNPNLLDNDGVPMNPDFKPAGRLPGSRALADSLAPLLNAANNMGPPADPVLHHHVAESSVDTDSQHRSDKFLGAVVSGAKESDGSIDLVKFAIIFGRALRARRIMAGMSVTEAAKNLQISKQYLSNIELGKSTIQAMLQYSMSLGIRPSSVLRSLGL